MTAQHGPGLVERMQQWGNEISRAITRISGGGSEMTLRIGEDFYADPVATCTRIEEKLANAHRRYSEAAARITALEAEKAELVEALRNCRRAVSSGRSEPRRLVREIVDTATEGTARAAISRALSPSEGG